MYQRNISSALARSMASGGFSAGFSNFDRQSENGFGPEASRAP
jgi:hypothetical protein